MSESFRTTSNLLILVDFTILTFAGPSQPPGDANVKINPLAAACGARWMLKQVQDDARRGRDVRSPPLLAVSLRVSFRPQPEPTPLTLDL